MNSSPSDDKGNLSFWDHLDELRSVLMRIVGIWLLLSMAAFFFKTQLFEIVLAPKSQDFVTYRLFDWLSALTGQDPTESFRLQLINTEIAGQFMTHMRVALWVALILASPYIIYQLFRFVSPALYTNERRYATPIVFWCYALFMIGMAISYFIVFPLTFRFLGMYQVSPDVPNMITLESYISTLMMLSVCMGIVFEIPVLMWLLSRIGLVSASYMRRYRRHAIVIILVLAAIITPTADVITLLVVSLPMWLLFEAGILVMKDRPDESRVEKS